MPNMFKRIFDGKVLPDKEHSHYMACSRYHYTLCYCLSFGLMGEMLKCLDLAFHQLLSPKKKVNNVCDIRYKKSF